MTNVVNLTPESTGKIIADVAENSILEQHCDFHWTRSNRDKIVRTLDSSYMKSHVVGVGVKTETDVVGADVTIYMENAYHLTSFEDAAAEDETELVEKTMDSFGVTHARSIDASIFGKTFNPNSNRANPVTSVTSVVDGTAASWNAAINKVRRGGNPSLIILDAQALETLEAAYVDGVSANALRDGTITHIKGIPVEVRRFSESVIDEGDVFGIVLDAQQLVVYAKEIEETSVFSGKEGSLSAFKENKVYLGTTTRWGSALANPNAGTLLVKGSISA